MTELIAARRRVAVFIGLFVFAVALLTTQMRSADRRQVGPVGSTILTVLLPVQAGMARVVDAGARWWELYTAIGRLREDNVRLRRRVEALSQEVTVLREQALAAQRLQRLLNLRDQPAYRAVSARVIGRDPSRWYATILVDRGSRDGVYRNAPVVTSDGVLGRVIEVTPGAARVLLIADSRSAVSVVVQRSRDAGVVEGRSGLMLHMKYLSRTSEVAPGDTVVTSGLGGVFPRGLVVGRITKVVREPGALQQEAEIEPAAALDRLEEVVVLLPRR